MIELQIIGYWRDTASREPSSLPDATRLVDPTWRTDEREQIVNYLARGLLLTTSFGSSPCRFGCGSNGAGELTDGYWLWPDGLAHYVFVHSVQLPDEVIMTMRANDWSPMTGVNRVLPPDSAPDSEKADENKAIIIVPWVISAEFPSYTANMSFWLAWGKKKMGIRDRICNWYKKLMWISRLVD